MKQLSFLLFATATATDPRQLPSSTLTQCTYLSSPTTTPLPPCQLIGTEPDLSGVAIGAWKKTCTLKEASATLASTSSFSPFQYAQYHPEVVGTETNINKVFDVGDRARACFGPETRMENPAKYDRKVSSLFYSWVPETCSLVDLNRAHLQQLLQQQNIVFLGDSVMNQFVSSVWALTGTRPVFYRSWILVNDKTRRPIDPLHALMCQQCRTSKNFPNQASTSDADGAESHCSFYKKECPSFGDSNVAPSGDTFDWAKLLPDTDVLVLNTGAHLHNVFHDLEKPGRLKTIAEGVAKFLEERFPAPKSIVWLRTPVYAPSCELAAKPAVQNKDTQVKYNLKDSMLRSWDTLRKGQNVWEKALLARKGLQGRVSIISSSSSNLRVDQHPGSNNCAKCSGQYPDCLHFCYPGGSDHWVTLLYGILKQMEEKE
jgi:hypothetical protein